MIVAAGHGRRRVVITGVGAVTAAGVGSGQAAGGLWHGVQRGRPGTGPITRFDPSVFPSQVAAEVADFDASAFMDARRARRLDRFAQFALAAGLLALDDASLSLGGPANGAATETAVYLGSALGGIAFAEAQHERYLRGGLRAVDPALALAVFGGAGATNLALELGLRGPAVGNSNSCASGAIAIGEAFRLIQSGSVSFALAGGAEAPLAPLTYGAFAVIRAMSTRNDDPAEACRPFDAQRDGFVMGEGACVLLLEELQHARARDALIYAELAGYGTTNDAYHITAPRPDGSEAARAMHLALADAGLTPEDVDYVNAHASSTPLGDRAEAVALARAFGAGLERVYVSGTKPLYGHPLGASGAIEAAIVALALHHRFLPATINLDETTPSSPESRLRPVPPGGLYVQAEVALSNTFGFGGSNACLVLRRWHGS
ncbi:MAG TPA: beta-ketoacyl-[acyl-carrier-protein] synthase family protein [Chloroflexota bacterium]|jgi:3-oxoacyl-[acyl-carrier-protein] synthase II|nr:beta-ketoacyl-[acyl-carrier-protein] synthase family protein [Chloroflexota bacterium]